MFRTLVIEKHEIFFLDPILFAMSLLMHFYLDTEQRRRKSSITVKKKVKLAP